MKKAIALFSGGKDTILSIEKARRNGVDIVAAFHINFNSSSDGVVNDVHPDVVHAIANAVGISDVEFRSVDPADMVREATNLAWAEGLAALRARHPDADVLIVSADGSQIANMQLFYTRLAQSVGMSIYVPYLSDYKAGFVADLVEQDLEIRMYNYSKSQPKPPYDINGVVPIQDIIDALNTDALNIYSTMQTIVTNGNCFNAPVLTVVDISGRIQLQ
jgi:diphthamide synthase (EF-2-diphthine--ammonia ligase)